MLRATTPAHKRLPLSGILTNENYIYHSGHTHGIHAMVADVYVAGFRILNQLYIFNQSGGNTERHHCINTLSVSGKLRAPPNII
jgi:hypothetical protein